MAGYNSPYSDAATERRYPVRENRSRSLTLSKTQGRAQKRVDKEQPEHVTSEDMAAFVEGYVPQKPLEAITEHLADCPTCRKTVARVTASQNAVRNPSKRKRR